MKKNGHFRNRIVGEGEEAPDQLLANPANWRIHPHYQEEALEGVLTDVGWVQRVIVNKSTGHVVDGHLRVALAIRRNEPSVPVVYVDLTEDEEKLILASLDPLSALASADREKLDMLLKEVNSDSAAIQQMLSELAAQHGLHKTPPPDPGAQLDRAAELQQKWQVERGDLWVIGNHRLLCGDSTVREDVERVMAGGRAILCVTSPPYWVNKDYEREHNQSEIETHIASAVDAWQEAVDCSGRIVINCGTAPLSHREDHDEKLEFDLMLPHWQLALRRLGWLMRGVRIWSKNGPPLLRTSPSADMHSMYWEFLATFYRPDHKRFIPNKVGEWALSGVWDFGPESTMKGLHSAPYPVELPSRFIKLYSDDEHVIFEPYGGSGTTMVACEQLGRQCRMIEIEPKYCAVILERMQGMGLEPSQN